MESSMNEITKDDIAIILPVHNQKNNVKPAIEKILPYSSHIIVIDDGSTDGTCEAIKNYPITVLRNLYRCGKDAALLRGFSYAKNTKAKIVMTIPVDKELTPQDFSKFLTSLQENPKSIIVGKYISKNIQAKNQNNKLSNFFLSLATGQKITNHLSEFRLYPIELLKKTLIQYSRKKNHLLENHLLIDANTLGYETKIIEISSEQNHGNEEIFKSSFIDRSKIAAELGWKVFSRGLKLDAFSRNLMKSDKK